MIGNNKNAFKNNNQKCIRTMNEILIDLTMVKEK